MNRMLVVVAMPALSGCTLVGLGIGASTPSYEQVPPPYASIEPGRDVRLTTTPVRSEEPWPPPHVYGRFRSADEGAVVLEDRTIPRRDVERVDVRTGTYWKTGLLVGACFDVTLAISIAVIASNASFAPHFSVGKLD